jgi:solute carrier family 25 (adenine nucleotide translocator) protein 4/5/6/31
MPEQKNSFMWNLFLTFKKTVFSRTITYPAYLVGTRKQLVRYPFTASNGKTYSGTILGVAQQLADEGFVNMIGLIPQCFRVIPTQMINAALKDPVKSFFKVEKDSSFFKRLLSNVLAGTVAGAISLAVVYGLDRYQTVSALPPECVTEPSTIYDIYSGYGLSVFGIMVHRGLYFGYYDTTKGSKDLLFPQGFMGHFVNLRSVLHLVCYPLGTISLTQMVHCCTISEAISIINDHPDGLWEGYMGGWKEQFVLHVVIGIGFHYLYKLYPTENKK